MSVSAGMPASTVCRSTPAMSSVSEGSYALVDGRPGVVSWIGYELSKPSRYFAGVKMVSLKLYSQPTHTGRHCKYSFHCLI